MALTVKQLTQLQSLQNFKLLAGKNGLDRVVTSAGLLDYEFLDNINYSRETAFEKESFVISSLLFAKDNKESLLPAIQSLIESGVSGFAYKSILFDELPPEALALADQLNFPIYKFGDKSFFENVIFEIMNAVQAEDNLILVEENIREMIEQKLTKAQVSSISKRISLTFKQNAMAIYIKSTTNKKPLELESIFRNFYLNRKLKEKALTCRYKDGMFAIITMDHLDKSKYEIVLNELLAYCGINRSDIITSHSELHSSYESLDVCLKESYYAFIVGLIEGKDIVYFKNIGTYQFLIPEKNSEKLLLFMQNYLKPIINKQEQLKTAIYYITENGNLSETANHLFCHINTVRYRINKIHKELEPAATDFVFFENLSTAIKIYLLVQFQNNETVNY